MMKKSNFKIAAILAFLFFVVGVATLPHYGINWDTVNHLPRGQTYLNYLVNGREDFSNLPPMEKYWQNPDTIFIDTDTPGNEIDGRSYWQLDATPLSWFMERDGGHPPLSDILSSVFNRILFGRLKLVNDIDSYRVYGVFLASLLAGFIYYLVSSRYGKLAGFVSFLSLGLYPLFWAESHFNTEKDVPETVYWSFFLYSFWKGITEKKPKWILLSGVLGGLALGTKLNILFSLFVIGPWLLYYFYQQKKPWEFVGKFLGQKKLLASLIVAPIITVLIFIGSWPFLWQDLLKGLKKVFGYYETIGTTTVGSGPFTGPFGIGTFPVVWILYTTPIVILVLSCVGVFYAIKLILEKKDIFLPLVALWVAVPIIRVSWPGASIYGGVRQIMEFIPAMAILSGLGAKWIYEKLVSLFVPSKVAILVVLVPFVLLFANLVKIHPNENAYFNELIGGLSGAKEKQIPSWGITFGGAYRQAASWVNKNAEEDARLVMVHELMPNIPSLWIRRDIFFHNTQRSGVLKSGEYAVTLTHDGTAERSYFDMYLRKFINPVFVSEVDGVPVVQVWKNDLEHTKEKYKDVEEVVGERWFNKVDGFQIDLGSSYFLSHLNLKYSEYGCSDLENSTVKLSTDGEKWIPSKVALPSGDLPFISTQPKNGNLVYPFLAEEARYIHFTVVPQDACLVNINSIEAFHFLDLNNTQ